MIVLREERCGVEIRALMRAGFQARGNQWAARGARAEQKRREARGNHRRVLRQR